MQQIPDKAKKSCMVSFRQHPSHLKCLSQSNLQGSRTESGFKRAFTTLSCQDNETFTTTMFLNVEQLEKQLAKEDFQEIGSMAAFNVLKTQFQMFIMNQDYLNDEYVAMTRSYFIQYTQQEILEFRNTLIQHLESVKKSIDERVQLKREYDNWVNERQTQTTEEKVDTNIRPIYDEEPMAEVQTTAEIDVFAIGQQHTKQPEFNNKGESQFVKEKSNEVKVKHDIDVIETINIELEQKVAKLLKENKTLKKNYKALFDSMKITRAKTIEHTTSLIATIDKFKAQLQEKGFAITSLKNELRKSTGNSVNTKFAKSSILGKPMSQPHRNRSVVRQPTTFKSERPRISKPREASSVKPRHMIPSSNSRISSKNMPRFTSNEMVHNHYQEEAKEKIQECSRNSEPSFMSSARSKSTANGSKPVPRRNTQTSRNWPASKNSFVTTKTMPIAEHPRNSKNDSCVTKFPKEVKSRAKVPSNKTPKRNKPVEQIIVSNKQERQIPTGHSFSIQKTSVGLRWVPTRRILTSSTTKVYSDPLNGSNADITNQYECEQILDVSAVKMEILLEPTANKLLVGLDDGVAALFQWSWIHHYMIMLKRQRHTKHQDSRIKKAQT
nr:hypothetical protein [Tanacetum cinerariifolium]